MLPLVLLVLATVLFIISGDTVLHLENQRYLNYADPVYVLNVLCGIVAVAVGGGSLIWLSQIAEKEKVKK